MGPRYPLIVAVPRPSPQMLRVYPYDQIVPHFDAVAPMVYWLNRQPDTDVAGAVEFFKRYGKPIIPVGQAYDGGPEGGRPGVPPRHEILRFMETAERHGAAACRSGRGSTPRPRCGRRSDRPMPLRQVRSTPWQGRGQGIETLLATSGKRVDKLDGTWNQSRPWSASLRRRTG